MWELMKWMSNYVLKVNDKLTVEGIEMENPSARRPIFDRQNGAEWFQEKTYVSGQI